MIAFKVTDGNSVIYASYFPSSLNLVVEDTGGGVRVFSVQRRAPGMEKAAVVETLVSLFPSGTVKELKVDNL